MSIQETREIKPKQSIIFNLKMGNTMAQYQNRSKQGEKIIVYIEAELRELIPGFLENRRKDIQTISEALAQDNYETIQILGHRMKGAGGGYGFDAITDIGSSLEQAAKDKDAGEIRKWMGELVAYLDRIEVVYDS